MLMPSVFGKSLLDDFFDYPSSGFEQMNRSNLMNTDIKETADGYEVSVNLPGFAKEDVKGELKDGYLIISAVTNSNNETKDNDGKYIRRERYSGSCKRSFYVGENVKKEDIKSRFQNGVLEISIPKITAQPAVEDKQYITIEG